MSIALRDHFSAQTGISSPEPFEIASGSDNPHRHAPQLGVPRAVLSGGGDVLRGTPQLEQAILQVGELRSGQHDRVFRQAPTLHRGAPLVRALPTGLRAIQARPALTPRVRDAAPAPGAVPRGARPHHCWIMIKRAVHGG